MAAALVIIISPGPVGGYSSALLLGKIVLYTVNVFVLRNSL